MIKYLPQGGGRIGPVDREIALLKESLNINIKKKSAQAKHTARGLACIQYTIRTGAEGTERQSVVPGSWTLGSVRP